MIWYIHRGAPNDTKIISDKEIIKLEKSFMQTTTAMIPYHRIFKIIYEGDIVEYETTEGQKGPQASNVTIIEKGPRTSSHGRKSFY